MNGPSYLLILAVVIFLLWKYSEYVKNAFAKVSKVTDGLKNGNTSSKSVSVILLGIGGITLLVWLYFTTVEFVDIVKWSHEHWFWVMIFGTIVYVFIIMNEAVLKGAAEVLKNIVTVSTLLILLLGSPLGELALGASQTIVKCPDASARETRQCVLNVKFSAPLKAVANESEVYGKTLCRSPASSTEEEYKVVSGGSIWRLRAKEGEVLVRYRFVDVCTKDTAL